MPLSEVDDAATGQANAATAPRLFSGRTGAGIRIAVVDSGVHPRHPHIAAANLAPGAAIARDTAELTVGVGWSVAGSVSS